MMPSYKRVLPNILTVTRMLAAVGLLFCRPFSAAFFFIYIYAGVSDCLDGPLARRWRSADAFGAKLDSVADLLFTGCAMVVLLPAVPWQRWMLYWPAAIACTRCATLCIGLLKYRSLPFLHTLLNKYTGVLLFLFPFLYTALGASVTAWILCVAASLSALEELIITLTRPLLDRDRRGLLFRSGKQ